VDGEIYTNTIEGCWALLKRGYVGTYHYMSRKYLDKYLDEFSFRHKTRNLAEQDRFQSFFSNMENRLRYKDLVYGEVC
jgi:hypothetical protein